MTIDELIKKNSHDKWNIENYSIFWDGSERWVLLERNEPPLPSGQKLYWPYNLDNPNDLVHELLWVKAINKMLENNVKVISLTESLDDPIRDFCWKKGCHYYTIIETFGELVPNWEHFAKKLLSEKYIDFFEYLFSLDGRSFLEELFEKFDVPQSIVDRVKHIDNKLKIFLTPYPTSIFGKEAIASMDKEKFWYYYVIPPYVTEDWIESPDNIKDIYNLIFGE